MIFAGFQRIWFLAGAGYSRALDVMIANDRDSLVSNWKVSTGKLLRTIDGNLSGLNDHFVFAPAAIA